MKKLKQVFFLFLFTGFSYGMQPAVTVYKTSIFQAPVCVIDVPDSIVQLVVDCRCLIPSVAVIPLILIGKDCENLRDVEGNGAVVMELRIAEKKCFPIEFLNKLPTDFFKFSWVYTLEMCRSCFKKPYGLLRGQILHELVHLTQFSSELGECAVINQRYPHVDYEADAEALRRLACLVCAVQYANWRLPTSKQYLTRSEAFDMIDKMDHTQRCAHHKGTDVMIKFPGYPDCFYTDDETIILNMLYEEKKEDEKC